MITPFHSGFDNQLVACGIAEGGSNGPAGGGSNDGRDKDTGAKDTPRLPAEELPLGGDMDLAAVTSSDDLAVVLPGGSLAAASSVLPERHQTSKDLIEAGLRLVNVESYVLVCMLLEEKECKSADYQTSLYHPSTLTGLFKMREN